MYRRSVLMFVILLFVAACAAPGRIKSPVNLFSDIDKGYPLSQYNLVLKTNDKEIFLGDPKLVNGELHAEYTGGPAEGKKLVFYSKENAEKAFERISDSSGKLTNHVIIRKESIVKVKVHDRFRGFDRRVVYDKDWVLHKFLLIFGFVIAFAVVLGFAIYAVYMLAQLAIGVAGFCYIATMVYGDYNAPEVLTLRKFRDEKLKPYFFGRIFIGLYYFLSPYFVATFRNNKTVNAFCRFVLDRWVRRLEAQTTLASPASFDHLQKIL